MRHAWITSKMHFVLKYPNIVNSGRSGEGETGVQGAQGTHVPYFQCYWGECNDSCLAETMVIFVCVHTSHVLVHTLHQSLTIGMKVGIIISN